MIKAQTETGWCPKCLQVNDTSDIDQVRMIYALRHFLTHIYTYMNIYVYFEQAACLCMHKHHVRVGAVTSCTVVNSIIQRKAVQ